MIRNLRTRSSVDADAGFTLIELLIVIVVIGILSGIAILAVGAFQSDAEDACTDANSRITDTVNAAKSANPSSTLSYASTGDCTP